MSQAIRVLVVDDHTIVRKGVCALLAEIEGLEVVGEAADGQAAIAQAETLRPDVILMDLDMPKLDGIEATRQIKASQAESRILVMTSFATDDKVLPAIKAGALGYLLKESAPEDLVQAIRQIHRGESSLHPAIARKILQEIAAPGHRPPTPNPLTERETEVLRMVAQGLSNQDIARKLNIGDPTVRSHVSNIMSKLYLENRTQAALYALREGLVSLEALPEAQGSEGAE
ncbi:MAG: response regulator transcription factor [Thermoflexales bacterium]|nr:response regulator transcription factor [Thermoflexales bacterium]